LFAITQAEADEPIGLAEYRLDGEWLTVPFIALAKAYRGWGYGSEAVRLLEEWAVREGRAERFRAEVDARNGLGLYFWLRLGYRPAEWHAEGGRDSMAMVRTAD
jgi:RimJ/RimL family protein N-acetyltransferase